jgi:hypothetical protein
MPVDADLSVTVSCLQALRAARNAGILVPITVIERATEYVKRCHTQWGFSYQPSSGYTRNDSRVTYPLTACGIVSLYSAGIYNTKEVRQAVAALERRRRELVQGRYHFFYGHYYAAQATYIAGGDHWASYYAYVTKQILSSSIWMVDGGWVDDVGRNYATAMACVILQMPCELLPIFQR